MTPGEFIEVFDTVAEAPGGVERLRELVLQLAVRGRLVPQDSDDEPASRLLERIQLEAKHAPKSRVSVEYEPNIVSDMPCRWESVYIGDAMALVNGRAFKPADWSTTGVPIVRIQNLNDPSAPYNYCSFSVDKRFYIDTGDLLLSWSGTPGTSFGAFIWNEGRAVLNQHIFRCEPRGEAFFVPYLRLAINSRLSKMIERAHGGVGLRHITKGKLQGLRLTLPPLAEQHRIVAKVYELMGLIDRLEAARRSREAVRAAGRDSALAALRNATTPEEVGAAWTRIAERMGELFTAPADLNPLREAVLQLAVRGRLVPQDSGEEPASKLVAELEAGKERLLSKKMITKPRYPCGVSVEQEPFEIPETWQWLRLGDVGTIVGGGTPRSGEPSFWSDGQDIPWLTPADMRRQPSRYISRGGRDITSEGLNRSSAQMLPAGSVLFSSRAPIGHVGIAANPLSTNQGFKSCVPYIPAMSDYLYIFLKYAGPGIDEQATGTTFKEVPGKEFALIPVPIPPLAEQHRIVTKVDELMALIDRLEQHLVAKEGIQGDFGVALAKRVETTIQ